MSNPTPAAPAATNAPAAGDTKAAPAQPTDTSTKEAQAAASAEEAELDAAEAEEASEEEANASGAAPKKETKKEAKASNKKKLKIKVDGQESEEEIDLDNDEELIKSLQKARAFDKKAQEASLTKKQMESLVDALKANPASVLAELGLNVDELAYNHLNQLVEESKKTPEQIEYEKAVAERDSLRKEKEELSKAKADAEMEALKNQSANEIQDQILTVLKDSKMRLMSPEDPEVIADIARAMLRLNKANQPFDLKDIVATVEDRQRQRLKRQAQKWNESDFIEIFGKEKMEELRKARVAKRKVAAKTETARQITQTGETKPAEPSKEKPKVAYKDFFKRY